MNCFISFDEGKESCWQRNWTKRAKRNDEHSRVLIWGSSLQKCWGRERAVSVESFLRKQGRRHLFRPLLLVNTPEFETIRCFSQMRNGGTSTALSQSSLIIYGWVALPKLLYGNCLRWPQLKFIIGEMYLNMYALEKYGRTVAPSGFGRPDTGTLRQSKNLAYNYRSINCKLSEGPVMSGFIFK